MGTARVAFVVTLSIACGLGLGPAVGAQETRDDQDESERFWGSGEYLLHWIADAPVDPLLAVGPAVGGEVIGATNPPGDAILVGERDLDYGAFPGGRLTFGGWLDSSRTWGLEGSGFFLDDQRFRETADSSGGSPYLAVPLAINGVGQGLALSFTNLFGGGPMDGSFRFASRSDLWGAEVGAWRNLDRDDDSAWDLLLGIRNLDLEEEVDVRYTTRQAGGGVPFAASAQDRFSTVSRFYGFQVGTRFRLDEGPWSLNLLGKVGLGAMVRSVRIDGNGGAFVTGDPDYPAVTDYGVFALPGNIGTHTDVGFSVVPEVRLSFGYQVTRRLRVTVGYDFLYCSGAARAADQIDTDVQTSGTIPLGFARTLDDYLRFLGPTGTTSAGDDVRESGFWTHGLDVGVELSF